MEEQLAPIDKDLLRRLDQFDDFMKKNQGLSRHGGLDYDELCLFPNIQLPLGFKSPKFSKYDGTRNPKTHLKMFANKLGKPVDDENLPMCLCSKSLERDALNWYSNLKSGEVKFWFDLSTVFVKQYEFNYVAPTRTTLEGTKRTPSEDHKTYAKWWRKLAAKVESPMTEEEIIHTFIKAHDPPYVEEIFRMTGSSFAAIINKLEEYDEFVKAGKIVNVSALKLQLDALQNQSNSGKKPSFKEKEGEIAFIWDQGPSFRPRIRNHPTYSVPYPEIQTQKQFRTFTNLGRPIDQLYEQLKAAGKIGTVSPKLYPRGPPAGYDPQAICDYHFGSLGHITDFVDPTQYIVNETEVFGVMEADHARMRKLPSVEEPITNDNIEKKLKSFVFEKEEPFIIGGGPSEFDNSKALFILDLPFFEWDISKPVILEFSEQMPTKAKVQSPTPKPFVSENEAVDFLKMLKRSEYKIVEQLDRMSAQISFLNLLLTSELHREALLKTLNEVRVPKDILVDKCSNIVENVLAANHITFSIDGLTVEGIGHNRALYISVRCNGKLLPRVLVDNGSALNISPWNTLTKLGFLDIKLRPSATVVRGFDGSRRESMGEMDLVLEIDPAQFQVTCQVMDFSSVYKLRRPWIHASNSVSSSLHQMLRFIVNDQLITVFAEDDCTMIVDAKCKGEDRKRTPISSHQVANIVSVGWVSRNKLLTKSDFPEASIMMAREMIRDGYEIGKGFGRELQGILEPIEILTQKNIFGLGFHPTVKDKREMQARKQAEKEGISTDIVVHRLPTDPKILPVKQKPLFKKSGEVRVCVDYRDLNKASPKDDFPLPNIRILLDNTTGHEIESFGDYFAGYHQILMAKEDREKTSFITPWETFCYRVMPFRLKNTRATYQRTMTTLFHEMIHKEMEVYVDDIIIKSKKVENYLVDLKKLLERLRRYNLKLNPAKCAFGAPAGISTDIVVHRLPTDPKILPVKQKPLFKKSGEVRVCVDYRDLNKASPKDDFPLPNIRILLDNTTGHEIESFGDYFAGYHQILMAKEDREKTSFITPWETFCYRVMPFRLKNTRATYQRTMTTLFHEMIHKEMEVYVDDIIIKSKKVENYLVDLKKLLERLRRYNLKLNPAKCAFGAPAGISTDIVVHRLPTDPKILPVKQKPLFKKSGEVRVCVDYRDLNKRTMTTLFHEMIHKEMEVYVDDIIIKSKKVENYLVDLKKLLKG
ncbi:uncharacterized protein [Coffea arabica]|uniref:G-patch domain-containing protein n=1 Tax=Coffea arabica TaxID=13443 RepID=A0ABM4UYG6_COFAR